MFPIGIKIILLVKFKYIILLKVTYEIKFSIFILKPKFDIVLSSLENNFSDNKIVLWQNPNGGYFISIDVAKGCAKKTVELCKNLGLILTPAGSTFPKKFDPNDSNIRIAPSYPSLEELRKAMDVLCLCIKLAFCEKNLSEND